MASKKIRIIRWTSTLALSALVLAGSVSASTQAQTNSRTFPETGKAVKGRFLEYWTANGGLPQQGYPISNEMQEKSDTDGKNYTVQYFERAVFESHPENAAPNDVLLSLLGNFLYKQKYPSGAPAQQPNTTAGSMLFSQTGKRLGGRFLQYWQQNGGLAQQGFPISDEFMERSALDGKTYRVQYFERAVFELHPENQAPFDVLLSQLGTFRYQAKYTTSSATPVPAPTSATVQQMNVTLAEWSVAANPASLKPGKITITVSNTGQFPHNLTVTNNAGQTLGSTPNFSNGEGSKTLTVELPAGTFTFLCSIPGHVERGQRTQVTVR